MGEVGGGLAVYVESEYLFPISCGRQYLFSSNFSKDHLFYDIAYLNLMDAGLFIYFPRDPGHNIAIIFILRCLTAKIFILKNCHHPSPRINCTSPKKRGTSFDHSQIVPTAMLHGLWPSIFRYVYSHQIIMK